MNKLNQLTTQVSSQINSRRVAIEALIEIHEAKAYANIFLPKYFESKQIPPVMRAFITELVYGTLRWQGFYDFLIAQYADRSFNQIDNRSLTTLRVGCHQLLNMEIENYAAVNETVAAAEILGKARSGFINAILRKVSQLDLAEIEDVLSKGTNTKYLSIRYSHPEWIVRAYLDVLKDEEAVKALLIANNESTKPDLLCWPTKSTIPELSKQIELEPILHTKNGFTTKKIPTEIDLIRNRAGAVQDRASQKIVELIMQDFEKNLDWLDMCAGPGGKAAYLYFSLLDREAAPRFSAYEVSEHRVELVKQLIPNQLVSQVDSRNLPTEKFDRILLDAPCTGLGALRRRPEARWVKEPSNLKELLPLQRSLLAAAAKAVRKFGFIYYVTCSPHQAETDSMVHEFLIDHPNFRAVPVDPNIDPNYPYHRSWTHKGEGDSMFMAKLERLK